MSKTSNLTAVILAGGQGSRLKPLTADLPKPLVPVGDQPILNLLLTRMRRCGVNRVYLAVNHLSDKIRDAIGDGGQFGLEVRYSEEQEPLSTVAPLKLIKDLPECFLVANGDVLTDLDFSDLYRHHLASGALVTVAVHRRENFVDYGVLETDDTGRLVAFKEKPTYRLTVSMGVYVFSKAVLDHVPENRPFGFDDLMYTMLEKGLPVAIYPYEGYWLDIGRPEDYERAQTDFPRFRHLFE